MDVINEQIFKDKDPDIICLQEHVSYIPEYDNYYAIGSCVYEYYRGKLPVRNLILVRKQSFTRPQISSVAIAGRCAVIADFNDFIVVNLHLTGGRFIDQHFQDFISSKDQHIEKLLYHLQEELSRTNRSEDLPIIIAGDFNGSLHFDGAIQQYKVYTDLQSLSDKHKFEQYYTGGHKLLLQNKFHQVENVGETSAYGTIVDYFYYRGQIKVLHNEVLDTLNYSDHNAIMIHISCL
jgi:endonuclease/exonuclease/phosphatase (EEP) superfamily protein YafD